MGRSPRHRSPSPTHAGAPPAESSCSTSRDQNFRRIKLRKNQISKHCPLLLKWDFKSVGASGGAPPMTPSLPDVSDRFDLRSKRPARELSKAQSAAASKLGDVPEPQTLCGKHIHILPSIIRAIIVKFLH